MKKRWSSMLMAVMLLTTVITAELPVTVWAQDVSVSYKTKTSGSGDKINVEKVTYDSADRNGISELDVDFSGRVSWKQSAGVSSIKDDKGDSYKGYLHDKDDDDCEIAIENLKEGRTYTIVIDGIKKRGTSSYRKLTLTVTIPSSKKASEIEYKVVVDDDEIEVKFTTKVSWKSTAKVSSVKDNSGKSYTGRLIDKDDDDCEIYIENMKYGKTYTIKISGIKAKGASAYQTLTVKAKVPKRTSSLRVTEVEYDDDDYDYGTVEFHFNKDVLFQDGSYIIVEDASGKKYSSSNSYVEWDDDECEVRLSKRLTRGATYQYKIVKVKAAGDSSYTNLTGSFVAD